MQEPPIHFSVFLCIDITETYTYGRENMQTIKPFS